MEREGRSLLAEFGLDPERLHLNHGSFGAVPLSVRAEQDRIRARMARDFTTFFHEQLPEEMRAAARQVAARFGGDGDDWVFCENATQAVNGVLASFPLQSGDEIVTTSHAYGAVAKAMAHWAARRSAKFVVADVPVFLQSGEQVVESIAAGFTPRTRLLVVDHITSATATVFPVAQIVEVAHAAGVAVLVDGAHAPGHIPLDVAAIGADWYTGNAHKWLFAPPGCGLLWTAPHRQAETFPAVLSWGSDKGYTARFDWIGTRDVTPWLCIGAAIAAHDRFGGPDLMNRNRRLAVEAADKLAKALGATVSAPATMRGAMAALALEHDGCAEVAGRLRKEMSGLGVVVPVTAFSGRLWLRFSAQIYNEPSDYERFLTLASVPLALPAVL